MSMTSTRASNSRWGMRLASIGSGMTCIGLAANWAAPQDSVLHHMLAGAPSFGWCLASLIIMGIGLVVYAANTGN